MIRSIVAAVVCCLYVAGSVMIVQREGRVYRAGLTETKLPPPDIEAATVSPTEAKESVSRPADVVDADSQRPEPATSSPVTPGDPPAPPLTELAKAEHVTPRSAHKAAQHPAAKKAQHPAAKTTQHPASKTAHHPATKAAPVNPGENQGFWKQPQLTHVWDIAYLKPDDERRMRDQLHDLIVRFNPLVEDSSPWVSRVEDAAAPFLNSLHRKEVTYNFFILNSDAVNAFSIPGGNIYISRGLFDLIGEDEDYALQFAVGHEMAHVDLEHAIKCLRDSGVMKMTEGTLTKIFMLILPFGYMQSSPVDQEFEADEWVATRMTRSRTRREILVFLQKLEGYSKNHGFYDGRGKPQPGRDLSPVENHYRAQTAARKRLKHLKEFMDQSVKAPK